MNNRKLNFKNIIIFIGMILFLFPLSLNSKNKKTDISNPNNINYKPEKANISISKKN